MKGRILIVDDEAPLRDVFRMFLEEQGYEARTAGSAEDGIAAAAKETFDAILLDNVLPGMTGLRALSELKKRAPVVLMTGHCDEETRRDALLLGAVAVLSKPIDFKVFDEFLLGVIKH